MRCALIIPSWAPEDLFPGRTAGSQLNYWQPLGTVYVASSLERAGHEVRFLDGAFLSHQAILDQLAFRRRKVLLNFYVGRLSPYCIFIQP